MTDLTASHSYIGTPEAISTMSESRRTMFKFSFRKGSGTSAKKRQAQKVTAEDEDEAQEWRFCLPNITKQTGAANDQATERQLQHLARKGTSAGIDVDSSSESSSGLATPSSTASGTTYLSRQTTPQTPSPLRSPLLILQKRGSPEPEWKNLFSPTPTKRRKGSRFDQMSFHSPQHKPSPHGSQLNPIEIEDEDDTSSQDVIQRLYPLTKRKEKQSEEDLLEILGRHESVADPNEENPLSDEAAAAITDEKHLTGMVNQGDFMNDDEFEDFLKDLALEEQEPQSPRVRTPTKVYRGTGFTCASGKAVELRSGAFVRIKLVFTDANGQVFISGHLLERQNYQELLMPKRRNEVVWVQEMTGQQFLDEKPADLFECDVSQVTRNRDIIFTNQRYPLMSSKDSSASFREASQDVKYGPLFCRWKKTTVHESGKHTQQQNIEHLRAEDADDGLRQTTSGDNLDSRVPDKQSRIGWRRLITKLGGNHTVYQDTFDLDGRRERKTTCSYTFGDAFCGAGGTSRGALDAGLSLKWGFDIDQRAMNSYKTNFSKVGTDCREEAVHVFLSKARGGEFVVDLLHISPPCQPFSPAHTVPSWERDEKNQAALFSVWQLLETIKPRVVTIEETEGLLSRHREWFSALINIFVHLGYSVRWKIVKCEHFGVPQTRKRLFIIASGPGEKLPPFARPRHDKNEPNLKNLVTIHDMIRNIPRNAADHDTTRLFQNGPCAPFSPHTQAKTLTCNGGVGNYHPNGTRPYTVREMASLQTFPLHHSFAGAGGYVTAGRRQVGNAVPPVLAKLMFRTIVNFLKESDAAEEGGV